jgi:hypothetical protein
MELLTEEIRELLLKNGRLRRQMEADGCPFEADFLPVVKLFTPDAGATWLLTETGTTRSTAATGWTA